MPHWGLRCPEADRVACNETCPSRRRAFTLRSGIQTGGHGHDCVESRTQFRPYGEIGPRSFQIGKACGSGAPYAATATATLRHSSAHFSQAFAHLWQWSLRCFAHSTAQASHASAQTAQRPSPNCEPRLTKPTQPRQRSAQSRHNLAHAAIARSPIQASPQCSHS